MGDYEDSKDEMLMIRWMNEMNSVSTELASVAAEASFGPAARLELARKQLFESYRRRVVAVIARAREARLSLSLSLHKRTDGRKNLLG